MKRNPLQRHTRAMNKAMSCYRAWQTGEAGTPKTRRLHNNYNRYLNYMDALEKAHPEGF